MDFENGRIQDFPLKFRSVAEDTERYLLALADLVEAGKIEAVPGRSLYQSHYAAGRDWIVECYFDKGLLDQLEAHFTPSGEVFFRPLHETERKHLNRLLEMGESARVRRIWRAHIGLMKPHYWSFVGERNQSLQSIQTLTGSAAAAQRASHRRLAARVSELKSILLDVMADYRALLASTGAAAADLARVDGDIAAIEAEERPRPTGRKDNRSMSEDLFWELIDHELDAQPLGERLDSLPDRLALFKPAAIRKFDQILRQLDAAAYRTDIWALAYLLQGGCSDDSFDAFRGWLILQGRAVFEATLADPDAFDIARHHGDSGGMDALRDAAPMAYELREGKPMKPLKAPRLELTGPEIDEDAFAQYLPRIAAAMAADGGA